MAKGSSDKYSAREQELGYIYQTRLALLLLLQQQENTAVYIEKDDDLDFVDAVGGKSLGSLKHKAVGDRVTNLSTDFWKSVRIWLARYKRDGRSASNLRFFLFTTATVSDGSFLARLVPTQSVAVSEIAPLSELAETALESSKSELIEDIADQFRELTETEKEDFLARIQILDGSPRIDEIPAAIKGYMRSIRREYRDFVFERIEGWWNDTVINQLIGNRENGIFGYEVSDKMSAIAEEYKMDNLPITFRGKFPPEGMDAENDSRLFVVQLREIDVSSSRIRNAILDYYRAFEQRSAWARENLLVEGEVEEYEDRLVDEWNRYKDVVFEELDENSAEEVLLHAGKQLYDWADQLSGNYASLRIRERVTEPYVTRGGFHILANASPEPRVYWHPRFLDRLDEILGGRK
jgi:hypothetical protein